MHHFANIHYDTYHADRKHDSDDKVAQYVLQAAIFLRWTREVGLLVEEDWHHDEANATDAAAEQGEDHVDVGERG